MAGKIDRNFDFAFVQPLAHILTYRFDHILVDAAYVIAFLEKRNELRGREIAFVTVPPADKRFRAEHVVRRIIDLRLKPYFELAAFYRAVHVL